MKIIAGENYLEGEEACRLLGIKPATLYSYVSRRIIKSYRQGIKRQRLYKQIELEKLIELAPGDISDRDEFLAPPNGQNKSAKARHNIPAAEEWIPFY